VHVAKLFKSQMTQFRLDSSLTRFYLCWNFKKICGTRNRVGIGLSYRPARLHRLSELIVVLLGSLSDLMSQGPQGHAKSLCAEVRRLNGMFHNSVAIVPFVPVPLCGINSASLVMGIMDVTDHG
jgi:hypothetical protein